MKGALARACMLLLAAGKLNHRHKPTTTCQNSPPILDLQSPNLKICQMLPFFGRGGGGAVQNWRDRLMKSPPTLLIAPPRESTQWSENNAHKLAEKFIEESIHVLERNQRLTHCDRIISCIAVNYNNNAIMIHL